MKLKNFDLNETLTSPWALWLISIITAVLMWMYVTGLEESAYINLKFTCPLEYRGLDSQSILRQQLSEVDVELRGPEEEMLKLDYNSVRAYVDARNLLPGKKYTVNINVEIPLNLTFVSCFPSQTTLDIVRQVTRLMNVEVVLPQNIPEGHYIDGVEIIPKEVGVKGAEDDLAKVGGVRITPTVDELQAGRVLMLPVKFSQSEAFDGNVTIEPEQVRFSGYIVRGLPRKRVPVIARLAGKPDDDYEVNTIVTDPSEVQIEGKSEDLAKVEAVDTEIIEISSMNKDSVMVSPLRQPEQEGVSLVNAPSVRVSIHLSEMRAEKMIRNIPVELRGTDKPGNWQCSPSRVTVTVEGKPSLIGRLEPETAGLKVYADMTNIFMTPVTLPLRTEILSEDSFRIVRTEPQNITVNAAAVR
ncbi:MAG: hypothetical protein IJQ08_00330 [Synergistaceae bacterium]|nr:hypothetical protein [Synergistaceae bacterium]